MKPPSYQPFKFDPNAELWMPPEEVEPGFTQTESGLWVPDAYARVSECWTTATYTTPEADWCAPPDDAAALKDAFGKAMENMEFGAPMDPPGLNSIKFGPDPLDFVSFGKSLQNTKNVHAESLQTTDGGPIHAGDAVYYKPNTETSERAQTETALADFIPNKATRKRLAELLYIGTEVCCLNLQRAHQHWQAQRKQTRFQPAANKRREPDGLS